MTTIKFDAVGAVVQMERETIDVTAVAGSSGTPFTETRPTRYVQLINLAGITPLEYRVDSGSWLPLGESETVDLQIDLSTSTLRARRAGRLDLAARAQISYALSTVESSAVQDESFDGMQIVVSEDAPNDADGRPDGTLWIQVA